MQKRYFLAILATFILLTLHACAAQEMDNATVDEIVSAQADVDVLEISNDTQTLKASGVSTKLSVESTTEFDVIGDYFKVKLTDTNSNAIKNTKITFNVNGKTYNQNTDSKGIASLQLRLNDGSYNIVTKFAGNSKYKASSLTTKITMDNTREVESGMSSSQIQNIIDNAKVNNVILFKGKSYSDVNLVIEKSLTLLSNVGTTLKSGSSSPVITIKGSKASLTTVKGFSIDGDGDGVKVDGSDYVKIINNDITVKGNGIVSLNTKYLNITKNDIVKNSKSGILIAGSSNTYIFNNKIMNNGLNGIEVAKSSNVYIHGNTISNNHENGVYLAKSIGGVNYGEGPSNLHISKNTIEKNGENGIYILKAGNNINIKGNSIDSNSENGISITNIGTNTIQSNVISSNGYAGINFNDDYVKPKNQEISYNAIVGNRHREVEAKDTYYSENGELLKIEDNWYGDAGLICPKIKTGKIKFTFTQSGKNQFQVSFIDSNGNLATLLPDRTLSYRTNNGESITLTISGGIATFTVDANDGDIIKATVDLSRRDNTYDSDIKSSSKPVNGNTPTYDYPSIPDYQIYEDIQTGGTGNGDGTGQGSGGNAGNGKGLSDQSGRDNAGNGTYSQKTEPSNNPNNPVNDVSQNYDVQVAASSASASPSGVDEDIDSGSTPESVVKQILIDEDEFFKVTGISFIILMIVLTIGLYYRDDIREMKSKL